MQFAATSDPPPHQRVPCADGSYISKIYELPLFRVLNEFAIRTEAQRTLDYTDPLRDMSLFIGEEANVGLRTGTNRYTEQTVGSVRIGISHW